MIQSIKVTNHLGESVEMELKNPDNSGFFVRGIEGLGPSKSIVNLTEVLSADGAFYNSSRIASRNIVLDLGFYNWGIDSIETIRQQTYRFFPMKKSLTIEITTDNRVGITTGFVESNEPDIFSNRESTIISIVCPSAFFYGKTNIQTVFSGVDSLFEFPWENPSLTLPLIEFGSVFVNTQGNVFYTGDEETGVVIYINVLGPVNDLAVYNATRGQTIVIDSAKVITITGSDLIAGDQIIISTIRGSKYIYLIRNNVIYNLLSAIGVNADWFRIDRGDNVFTYTADSGLANLQFLIEHRIVYGGL